MTWPCLQQLKLTKRLSQKKDQDIVLFIEDIEIGAKYVDFVKMKNEKGCIDLAMLAALEASKWLIQDKDQHIDLFIEEIESASKLVGSVKMKNDEECIDLAMLAALEAYKEVVTRQRSRQ